MIARRLILVALVALCSVSAVLVFSSAPALALSEHVFSLSFGGMGSGEDQFEEPSGVAVSEATGDVYVVDKGNNRVEQFTSTGTYIGQFNGSGAPTGPLSSPSGIAVDNSGNPVDPSNGDVYVVDGSPNAIYKFSASGVYEGQVDEAEAGSTFGGLDGVAVDPNGVLWVYQANGEIDDFSDALANVFLGKRQSPFGTAPGLAVDSQGSLYVNRSAEVFAKLDSSGSILIEEVDGERSTGAAVDPSSDEVYVDNSTTIGDYTAAGLFAERFGSEHLTSGSGVAVDSSAGLVYVADSAAATVVAFKRIVLADVSTGTVSGQTEESASVGGAVNPAGVPVTSCVFEYGTTSAYGQSAPCSSLPGSGEEPVAVSASLTGLQFGETYHYRLAASNASGTNHGEDRTFVHGATIDEEFASNVASTSATLGVQINPNGADTRYRVEYGTDTSYGSSLPVPDGNAGSSLSDVTLSVHPQDLQPGIPYHYRFVAGNAVKQDVQGPDRTFTTQALGGGTTLADGRQWELVSPVGKLGEQVTTQGLRQTSEDGSAIAYPMSGPFVADAPGNVQSSEAISKRGPDGWSTEDIATPHSGPAFINYYGQEYVFFSSDLSHALAQPLGETPLSPEATEKTLYTRDDATGVYTPLVYPADVPPGTKFGGVNTELVFLRGPLLVTSTPDESHVVLRSKVALTTDAVEEGHEQYYYEWSAGRLRLVTGEGFVAGRRAVSNDGSRIFWQRFRANQLYMTNMTNGEMVRIDRAQGVAEPSESAAYFQMASGDGSLVYFTDSLQLTSSPGGGLYAYDVETGKLTLVTVPVKSAEEAGIGSMVLGASEDGSYVYLEAKSVLSQMPNAEEEKAIAGANNLYVLHHEVHGVTEEWKPSFIAALSVDDGSEWDSSGEGEEFAITKQTVEVSRSGRYLAFMSDRSLTGYDNRDASSGAPDEEVYRYDVAGAQLVCASCDPTGARPSGWLEPGGDGVPLSDTPGTWVGRGVAATIRAISGVANGVALYEPKYMLDDGRLFFDSHDALVAQDINGVDDVYEYEPDGVGGCASGNGCVALLSGGVGARESAFEDASVSGDDVFFMTADLLASQDVDTAYDMYDARACTTEAPCPSSTVALPSCETADSCKGALTPQPGVFGAPASATFNGAGNVTAGAVKHAVKPKARALTRAQKLARALKGCRKRPKQRQAVCEAKARRSYGTAHKAKKTGRRGK
jgi:hypothetical protein